MSRFVILTALGLVALSLLAGAIGYLCLRPHAVSDTDSLAWLRQEFELSDSQLRSIETLHRNYAGVCALHCEAIREQREAIDQLQREQAPQETIAAAVEKARAVDAHCIASTQAHAREIAAIIGGEQGARYLETVLPRIARLDHRATPDLTFNAEQAHAGQPCH